MEYEERPDEAPAPNKQAFIYKKNPASANKAITRKLRQSHAPQVDSQGTPDTLTAKAQMDEARTSHNEAETIATAGHNSVISPRGQALSQSNFNRLDSEVIATSEAHRKPLANRRFHTSHRQNTSTAHKLPKYYEDNIDSETEVFYEPQYQNQNQLPSRDNEVSRQQTRQLIPNQSAEDGHNYEGLSNDDRPRKKKPSAPLSQDDHFKAIDAVIKSNVDDAQKQRMIADIQEKYRRSQAGEGARAGKPRNQKQYKDPDGSFVDTDDQIMRTAPRNPAKGRVANMTSDPRAQKKSKTAKTKRKAQHRGTGDPEDAQFDHQNFLMPEMNDFMMNEHPFAENRNYLTQDENKGDSRLAQLGHNKRHKQRPNANESADDDLEGAAVKASHQHFTPGRIRASRMGRSNMQEHAANMRDNYIKSPSGVNFGLERSFDQLQGEKPRNNRGRSNREQPSVESIDKFESNKSISDADYKQILPSVKMRAKKKKKRSPSSPRSGGLNSSGLGQNSRIMSQSRMSTQGMRGPKLRDTLDQSLHFMPASVKVPIKQTNFYDDKHDSHITDQQMKNWRIQNGNVMLDEFHSGKKKIPPNRHRIPAVGDSLPAKKRDISPPGPNDQFVWDMDGRRHKQPKKKAQRVITTNASYMVDLPRITPGQTAIISGDGKVTTKTKFVDKQDPRVKKPKPPQGLNQKSNTGFSLVDINIPNGKDPQAPIYEPPFNADITYDKQQPDPELPDYDCPVCKERVDGKDTPEHSRNCRTARCRFCKTEQAIATLDIHEAECKDCRRCPFCKLNFFLPEFTSHTEQGCNEAAQCRCCHKKFAKADLNQHEFDCTEGFKGCRFCLVHIKKKALSEHEAKCDAGANCHFCDERHQKVYLEKHFSECPEAKQCTMCLQLIPQKNVGLHQYKECPSGGPCQLCHDIFTNEELETHFDSCPKKDTIDEVLYQQYVYKNKKKLEKQRTGKVVVEDDYIQPGDFRLQSRLGEDRPSVTISNSNGDQGKPPTASASISRKHSRGSKLKNRTSPDRAGSQNQSAERVSIERASHSKPPKSPAASVGVRVQSPFSKNTVGYATSAIDGRNHRVDGQANGSSIGTEQNAYDVHSVDQAMRKSSKDYQITKQVRTKEAETTQVAVSSTHQVRQQHQSSNNINQEVKLTKIKSQQNNTGSQVRFAYGTTDSFNKEKTLIREQTQVMSSTVLEQHTTEHAANFANLKDVRQVKVNQSMETDLKQFTAEDKKLRLVQQTSMPSGQTSHQKQPVKILKQPTEASLMSREQVRVGTATTGKRSIKSKSLSKSVKRRNTQEVYSRESKARISNGVLLADNKSSNSRSSKSPQVRRVMEKLTHHRVKIDQETKLLINGSEVLSHKGIKGNIHKVGLGFGTGRHTSGRRMDLLKEVQVKSQASQSQERPTPVSMGYRKNRVLSPNRSPLHRAPVRMDAMTQHREPEVHSEGCDPIPPKSVRSMKVSAHCSQKDINLSARTQTVMPERESVGVSARPISEASVREQADQVSDGRFDPVMIDTTVNTERRLLEAYLRKPMTTASVNTAPVIFGSPRKQTMSAMVQTEPLVSEIAPDEPQPAFTAHEPATAQVNDETGSNSSLLDVPAIDTILEEIVLPPPQEPDEDPYVDDWAESTLYKYVFEMHYEKMVKKKLFKETVIKRPQVPKEQEGMTQNQRYEHNLNPKGLEILSYMECDYGQAALRHKSATYRDEGMLKNLFERAKTTIQVLNSNMVRPDICDHILFSHYQEPTKKNVIKLLLRVKRLYDARNESVNILKLVMEVEAVIEPKSDLWRIMQDNSRLALKKPFQELMRRSLKILSNALMRITIFQQEHHLFKDEFKFNKREYRDYIRDIGLIMGGFLKMKHEPNPALQETGLLQEEHEEHSDQTKRYEEWVAASIQDYGRLDVPEEADIEQLLETERPSKKLKGSRIDAALEKLREEQKNKSETNSTADLGMTLTSKSKILAQMQMKSDKLEVQVQSQWQRSAVSDQMLARMQESAQKRNSIARYNEERMKRHEEGYQTPEDEPLASHIPNQKLLNQQMQYDDEMEDQETQNDRLMTVNEMGKLHSQSMISSQTNIVQGQKRPIFVSGDFQDFKQINVGKYDFVPSDRDQVSVGRAYDKAPISIPTLQGEMAHQRNQSQIQLKTDRNLSSRRNLVDDRSVQDYLRPLGHGERDNQSYTPYLGGNGRATPSEATINLAATSQLNLKSHPRNPAITPATNPKHRHLMMGSSDQPNSANQEDCDCNETEFTEQMDNDSRHIGLEESDLIIGADPEKQSQSENEDQTVFDAGEGAGGCGSNADANSRLRIVNQGSIKIKYAADQSSRASQASRALSPQKSDSLNERQ